MRGHLADARVEGPGKLMPLHELDFGAPIEGRGSNPVVEPRHSVGSLQQRLWSVGMGPPEDLIAGEAQQGSQQQTGSDANGRGSGDSHNAPFTFAIMMPDSRLSIN